MLDCWHFIPPRSECCAIKQQVEPMHRDVTELRMVFSTSWLMKELVHLQIFLISCMNIYYMFTISWHVFGQIVVDVCLVSGKRHIHMIVGMHK